MTSLLRVEHLHSVTLTQHSCTSIDIVDDSVSESSNECFTLELSDGTETIDNPKLTTVCITDDDG